MTLWIYVSRLSLVLLLAALLITGRLRGKVCLLDSLVCDVSLCLCRFLDICPPGQDDMGLDATKPVFGVPDKKRLKSVSSARETS